MLCLWHQNCSGHSIPRQLGILPNRAVPIDGGRDDLSSWNWRSVQKRTEACIGRRIWIVWVAGDQNLGRAVVLKRVITVLPPAADQLFGEKPIGDAPWRVVRLTLVQLHPRLVKVLDGACSTFGLHIALPERRCERPWPPHPGPGRSSGLHRQIGPFPRLPELNNAQTPSAAPEPARYLSPRRQAASRVADGVAASLHLLSEFSVPTLNAAREQRCSHVDGNRRQRHHIAIARSRERTDGSPPTTA